MSEAAFNASDAMTAPATLASAAPADFLGRWSDRWRALRDRLLASPTFRRRAAAFPPTRPIARKRAGDLFDLVAGFVYSQVLLACIRLDLFKLLAEGPETVAVIAARLDLPVDSARRLLAAAVALRLVEQRRGHERYGLGALGAALVGNEAVVAMVEHHSAFYADMADPVGLLRGGGGAGELSRYWPYAADSVASAKSATAAPAAAAAPTATAAPAASAATIAYTALMSASQPLVADEILDAYPVGRHRCLLDVGGGDGSFLAAAAARAPNLRLVLFDLPVVAERARERLAARGLADRSAVVAGSFLNDRLPEGADLVSLVRVVHDHDDDSALTILRAVCAALPFGGRLLLAEPMAATPGAERMGDAYFGFYLLAMGGGRPRSAARLTEMLVAAGFERVRRFATRQPLQTSLLIADVRPIRANAV